MISMMRSLVPAIGLALLFAPAPVAHASVLFYTGDPSQFTPGFYYTAINVVIPSETVRVYEDVAVPAGQTWNVTGIFAQVANPDPNLSVPLTDWDFRTGLTVGGSGGALLFSGMGTLPATTVAALPYVIDNGQSGLSETLTVTLSSPVVLAGGQTYWFDLAPHDPNSYNWIVAGGTVHANSVGGPLDDFSIQYVSFNNEGYTAGNVDYSLGLLGDSSANTVVPEPSTVALAVLPLLLAGFRRLYAWRGSKRH